MTVREIRTEADIPFPIDQARDRQGCASHRRPKQLPPLEKLDGAALMAMDFPELDWVLEGLLPKGLTLLNGRPKVGKSWLTLQIALHVAQGTPLFGEYQPRRAGRVTYLALEEPARRTKARILKFIQDGRDPSLGNLQFIYRIKPILAGGKEALDRHLAESPSDLVIVDTLLACSQGRGNRDVYRADYAEVNALREIAEKHGAALLLVVHSRKASAEYHIDSVAGTSGVTAAADSIWSLTKRAEGAMLECTGRETEDTALALRLSMDAPCGWHKTGSGDAVRTTQERAEIRALLKEDGAMKPKQIASELGKNPGTVRRLLQEMLNGGQVFRNQDGTYVSS